MLTALTLTSFPVNCMVLAPKPGPLTFRPLAVAFHFDP